MRHGQLRDHFLGVGAKYLSAVDAEPMRSNQHEIGVTQAMRDLFLGEYRQHFTVRYIWLGGEQDGFAADGTATYYDTRQNQPLRPPEWRLYYPSNPVTETMSEGDALFLAPDNDGLLYFIVAPAGSTSEQQLSWLFGVQPSRSFVSREVATDEPALNFAARFILDELGVEFQEADEARLDDIVKGFAAFPSTDEFSALARQTLPHAVSSNDDPDNALLAWLEHEEDLFRCLERRLVAKRLQAGFDTPDGADVDGFVAYSLSVQNRRKARMGRALENHVEAVFRARELSYDRSPATEHGHRPDFLFPGIGAYRAAPDPGAGCLAMLGAKSTCKDRWRQVLVEADKIPEKHLLTLEPGISKSQTDQMDAAKLQLVVPRSIHGSYTETQRIWLWTFDQFIREVEARQA